MINETDIKERLIKEIAQSGMTNTEIAKRVGISITCCHNINIKKMPSLETFAILFEVLEVSSDYILGLKVF